MPRIASGQRDHAVVVEQLTQGTAASGFPIETWTTLDTVWMSRRDLQANERFAASQPSAWGTTEWQMPYRADMDPELVDVPRVRRLTFGGRVFDIQAASVLERRLGISLTTLAKVD